MAVAALSREVCRLRTELARHRPPVDNPTLSAIRQVPAQTLALAGLLPDPWQAELLSSQWDRALLLASRQSGKSQVSAAIALRLAMLKSAALILLLSPSLRQSGELFRDKLLTLYNALGRPLGAIRETALELQLANNSRIVSLPGNEQTVRGFSSVDLLVIDEAAMVEDPLYFSIRPMLAIRHGRLLALTTPRGQRGWFFDAWKSSESWERIEVPATRCPRLSAEFLREERIALGPRWYAQEYCCSFEADASCLFDPAAVRAAFRSEVKPLFGSNA